MVSFDGIKVDDKPVQTLGVSGATDILEWISGQPTWFFRCMNPDGNLIAAGRKWKGAIDGSKEKEPHIGYFHSIGTGDFGGFLRRPCAGRGS